MKLIIKKTQLFLLLFVFCLPVFSADYTQGNWQLSVNANGTVNISKSGKTLISNSQGSFKIGSTIYLQENCTNVQVSESSVNDNFGSGKCITITSKTNTNHTVTQKYYLYNDYILTDLTVSGTQFESNYMAPIKSSSSVTFLPSNNNKVLRVPFDNDKWAGYLANSFGTSTTSYEVTAIYNSDIQEGLVVGSIDHTQWKTGVKVESSGGNSINSLEIFGGITTTTGENGDTRDKLPHGAVQGTSVSSPKMFIGHFNDWRDGLELFGDVNAIFKPKLAWSGKKPFLWNSWGVIQDNINYSKARQVSDWIKNNLQKNSFVSEDNTVYINLDSYWDRLGGDALRYFVPWCENNGQKAGIYWAPFVNWHKSDSETVEGSTYKYSDIYVRANGAIQSIDGARCLDPTHPGTQDRIRYQLGQFRDWGYTFVKLDFMTHGAVEGAHYNPNCYTGIQAYNEGMAYIVEQLQGKMFINLSISPLFPGNYAHSRRIACDAYSLMNETKYTLNSTTYGWWLDHIYSYNDADHVVLTKNNPTEGENRARITSSAITGIFTIGDDYSDAGSSTGKDRSTRFLTIAAINEMARKTKAFRPLKSAEKSDPAEIFYQKTADGDTTYVAIFNYNDWTKNHTINFSDLGISGTYDVTELWSNTRTINTDSWSGSVNGKDCKILKINPLCTDPTDSDNDGVPDCYDPCPDTPAGKPVDENGCEIPLCEVSNVMINFEKTQLTSFPTDANIKSATVVANPDQTGYNRSEKYLHLETNATAGTGEALYGSGITLNFPSFNTDSKGRYMHIAFKTNTEKVEFYINGSWGPKFNPRTQVVNNGWFDYVIDLGSNTNLSQIKIMFDMRTGSSCDTSDPIGTTYNNHNKYMYIDEIELNNSSAPRSFVGCPPVAINSFETGHLTTYVNAGNQIVVNVPYPVYSELNKICVYNISGKKITEQALNGAETVIDTCLDAGVYLVQLFQDNSVKTAKVLVY